MSDVSPEILARLIAHDVTALAEPILKHRMALNFNARSEGIDVENIISKLVKKAI